MRRLYDLYQKMKDYLSLLSYDLNVDMCHKWLQMVTGTCASTGFKPLNSQKAANVTSVCMCMATPPVIPPCLSTELAQFPLRMRDWLKNVLLQLYEHDTQTPGFLTPKQRARVRKHNCNLTFREDSH